jgi:hypothetical protein
LAVLALAFRQRVQPNWPAAIYPAGIVFLVAWILGCTVSLRAPMDGIRVLRRTLFVSAIFIALTYLIPLEWSFRGTALDLAARLREWHSLGKEIGITFKQIPNPDKTFIFAATSKIAASELAFYLPGQPQVYLFNPNREAASQYDLWPGPWRKIGWNALIVTDSMEPPPLAIKERFRRIEFLRPVSVPIGNDRAHAFALWHGIELF